MRRRDTWGAVALKLAVLALAYGYVGFKLSRSGGLWEKLWPWQAGPAEAAWLLLALLLAGLNFVLEAGKWRLLVSPLEKVGLGKALKAFFSGMALAVVTPNRLGDLGGRVASLARANRLPGVAATAVGSYAQFLCTLLLGLASLAWMAWGGRHFFAQAGPWRALWPAAFALAAALALWLYLRVGRLRGWMLRRPRLAPRAAALGVLASYSRGQLLSVLGISLARYAVFSLQYLLLLRFFGLGIAPGVALAGIAASYLANALVPSFALSELGVRGSSAIFFLSASPAQAPAVFMASSLLWLVNLGVPALLGGYFFARARWAPEPESVAEKEI